MGEKRGPQSRKTVFLPTRPFLYTPDQIGAIIGIRTQLVLQSYLFYAGRSLGGKPAGQMTARNINPDPNDAPIWRISEQELIRWMQYKGFKFYDRYSLYSDSEDAWGLEKGYGASSDKRKNVLPDSEGDPVDPYEQEG